MSKSLEPLVSIVTPLHNEEAHLPECIESIIAQTYENWDYTIVDNCSTDASLEIARRYAARDRRIRICENRQLLRAIPNHSTALHQISPASKYCKVVFGDDWIFPECLERMVRVAEEHPSVGIVGAFVLEGDHVGCTGLPYPTTVISGREICRRHFLDKLYVFGSANSILYRSDLVRSRHPFYNPTNIHADTEACFALLKTSDFGFVHQVLTFTRVRPGSLTKQSEYMQSDLAGGLHILVTLGSTYLSGEELADSISRHLSEYYKYLAKRLIFGRDKDVWEFHKARLVEAGVGFSRVRLATALVGLLCGGMLAPKESAQKLLKRLKAQDLGDLNQGRKPAQVCLDNKMVRDDIIQASRER
jgi:glycosyltransferase involved in cell wall biosynthesis